MFGDDGNIEGGNDLGLVATLLPDIDELLAQVL